MPLTEALEVTFEVVRIFESLGVDYLVGGSMASSLHGVPRATLDVDLVADLQPEHVRPLIGALEPRFYVSHEAVREAVVHRSSFNIIEQQRVFKVDVFVLKNDELAREEMERRERYVLGDDPDAVLVVASAEDIVLQKLDWYRLGEGVSDRQWRDVQGVLKVRGPLLDREYLRSRADGAGRAARPRLRGGGSAVCAVVQVAGRARPPGTRWATHERVPLGTTRGQLCGLDRRSWLGLLGLRA